jgi:hypothetical protein
LQGVRDIGAAIVICPSTEANLGDGVFDYSGYARLGGRWSIGSDSHVTCGWTEELRLLEYSQRLTQRRRNVAAQADNSASSAAALFQAALAGGGQPRPNRLSGLLMQLGGAKQAPLLHQLVPLLKQVAPPVSGFDFVTDRVRQRHLDHLVGKLGFLGRPVAERRAESVRHNLGVARVRVEPTQARIALVHAPDHCGDGHVVDRFLAAFRTSSTSLMFLARGFEDEVLLAAMDLLLDAYMQWFPIGSYRLAGHFFSVSKQ